MKSNGAERSLAGDKLGERGSRRQTGTGSSQRRESQPEAQPSITSPRHHIAAVRRDMKETVGLLRKHDLRPPACPIFHQNDRPAASPLC